MTGNEGRERRMLVRGIRRWRKIETRYTHDALHAIRVFSDPGRPMAVNRFIDASLTTARAARDRAATLESRLADLEG